MLRSWIQVRSNSGDRSCGAPFCLMTYSVQKTALSTGDSNWSLKAAEVWAIFLWYLNNREYKSLLLNTFRDISTMHSNHNECLFRITDQSLDLLGVVHNIFNGSIKALDSQKIPVEEESHSGILKSSRVLLLISSDGQTNYRSAVVHRFLGAKETAMGDERFHVRMS